MPWSSHRKGIHYVEHASQPGDIKGVREDFGGAPNIKWLSDREHVGLHCGLVTARPGFGSRSAKARTEPSAAVSGAGRLMRSEERRVGKECRSRWWPSDLEKKRMSIGGALSGKYRRALVRAVRVWGTTV